MREYEADRHTIRGYLIAFTAVLATLAFRLLMDWAAGLKWHFVLYAVPVMVAARYGGRGPALAATAVSLLAVFVAFGPQNRLAIASPSDPSGVAIFILTGVGISLMAGQLRDALLQATTSERALKREVTLVDLSHDAIIVADGRHVITGWNKGAATLYGWSESEAIGKVTHQLLRTESDAGSRAIDEILASKDRWDGELLQWRSDGTRLIVESRQVLVRDPNGAVLGILEINRDNTRRKQAELELQRSEETTRALIESASQGIVGVDSEGRIVVVNTMAEQLFGYHRAELLGQSLELLVPESLRARHEGHRQSFDAGPRARPMGLGLELLARRKDGSQFAVEISLGTAETAQGRLSVSFVTDITARRQVEAALEEASELRGMAIEAGGLGAWDYRMRSGEVFWDQRCREMFGSATGAETDYDTAMRCIHPEDRAGAEDGLGRAIAGVRGGAFHEDFRVVWPDGSVHWVASHGRVYFEGEGAERHATRFIGINSDISERKDAENSLRRNAALLRAVCENTPDCVFLKDRQNRILLANPATLRLFGKNEQEVIGKSEAECLVDQRQGIEIDAADSLTMQRGDIYQAEETIATPEGDRIFLSAKTPWRSSDGDVIGLISVARDITERERAQEEILRLNAELEQRVRDRTAQLEASNKELEAFAYSVSHDLRAPLRGIDGWSLALLEEYGGRLDPMAHRYLDRVRSESQRMGFLIDDLLNLSRVTRAQMRVETVDLSLLVRLIAGRLREAEPGRQMEFAIQAGLIASGDPRLLEVALTNLLSNAAKFTRPRAQARIEFGLQTQDEPVYHVTDNGVGFDMNYAHTLFGAFQRLHKVSEFPGSGIGLATVQRIVIRHGGKVWAQAEPDQGATFFFTLNGSVNP